MDVRSNDHGRRSISCRRSSSRLCIHKRRQTDSKSKEQNKPIVQCLESTITIASWKKKRFIDKSVCICRPRGTQSWKLSTAFYQINYSPQIPHNTHSPPLPSMSLSNHVSCAHPHYAKWVSRKCFTAALMIGLGVVEVFWVLIKKSSTLSTHPTKQLVVLGEKRL